jgi:membrane protein YqaA with SNARE-associated domain
LGYGARVAGELPPRPVDAPRPFARLERLASGPAGPWAVAAWGFAEALFLPVVPDVLLCLLALAVPGRAWRLFAATIAGALAGSLVLYVFAQGDPVAVERLLMAIPGVTPATLDQAQASVAGASPYAFATFGSGIPLKVYTVAWASGPGGLPGLLVGVVVNRLTRVGPAVAVAYVIGRLAPGALRRHDRLVAASYVAFWLVVYVLYLF